MDKNNSTYNAIKQYLTNPGIYVEFKKKYIQDNERMFSDFFYLLNSEELIDLLINIDEAPIEIYPEKILEKIIARIIKNNNLGTLLDLYGFGLDNCNKDKLAELIIKYNNNLDSSDVYALLKYSINKEHIAELLGNDNINKLNNIYVRKFFIFFKNDKENLETIKNILKKIRCYFLISSKIDFHIIIFFQKLICF